MTAENVYRKLQQHLDAMPVPYPATESGVELRLLRHLFTPEEAEVALNLSAVPESLRRIQARAKKRGIGEDRVVRALDRLAKKGAILKRTVEGEPRFGKLGLAIGMFEFQVNRLTREFHADVMEYMDEAFAEAFHTRGTSQMRTIPIHEEVLPERRVGTYDGAKSLVMESDGPFVVVNCVCRQGMDLQETPCRQTDIRETCLVLGDWATMVLEKGGGKEVSREEMMGFLDQANEIGMVLQPQNIRKPNFICCCCGCCCGVLSTAKKLPSPADFFDSNYFAEVEEDLCDGCMTCGDRCLMEAIGYEDSVASVDLRRCIGCGLCVTTCPQEAIRLREKPEPKTPPRSEESLYRHIMSERFGPLGTARIAAKKMLGMKI